MGRDAVSCNAAAERVGLFEVRAECAASGAQIIDYGWHTGEPTPFPLFPAFKKSLTFRGYTLYEFVTDPLVRPEAERFVFERLEQGKLNPKIDRRFQLSQIVEAHRYLESNQQVGKVVVTVPRLRRGSIGETLRTVATTRRKCRFHSASQHP